jgi:isopentenyl-diphosphate delta-isomerase
MNLEKVILVDENDNALGLMEKMEAHEKALLHRAFSVFTFNNKGELLIHQRAHEKYHSGGLWTNTCCSHPREGETTLEAAKRRLQEEMGFVCELNEAFSFIYKAELDQGLTEHEYDHVFIGEFNGEPQINPNEVADWKYVDLEMLKQDVDRNPENYTVWFKIALKELEKHPSHTFK